MIRLAMIAAAWFCVAGCASTSSTRPFDDAGFGNSYTGYRIEYETPRSGRLLGAAWAIDNYVLDARGTPLAQRIAPTDIVLRHRSNASMIWADSVPVGPFLARAELGTLAENFVSSLASNGYLAASIGTSAPSSASSSRFAPTVLDSQPVAIAGQAGRAVLVSLHPEGPLGGRIEVHAQRCLLVFVRLATPRVTRVGYAETSEPLLLVAGYASDDANFDSHLPEFTRFLDSLRFPSPR